MSPDQKELLKKIASLSPEQVAYLKNESARRHKTSQAQEESHQDASMAITGIAFNFPGGARDLESFWDVLAQGKDCIRKLDVNNRRDNKWRNPPKEYWGGFLEEEIDTFDPSFFRILPKEAALLDPQHRFIFQSVWKALEDAAYVPSTLSGSRTGVYMGLATYDYNELTAVQGLSSAHVALGNAPSLLANRISYFFDWHGPSETIDTACSSSLVALHQAVGSLQKGECDQAIVGGVSLLISSRLFDAFTDAGMLSPNGRCRTLDAQADGYVRGEGVAVIVLKPLRAALKNKERIYGIIRGTAVNHGGKANSLTAPNPKAQTQLLVEAYTKSKTSIETVSYIEMHGTGTPLGDPIEVEALQEAFRQLHAGELPQNTCGLGSVKSNIGHLEAVAGLTGLIKILACLRFKQLPPTVHFKSLNPYIRLEDSPFYVAGKLQDWTPLQSNLNGSSPRRAGVSSFGFGGANAHVVIEEGREFVLSTEQTKPSYLLTLSAKHPDSLKQKLEDLRDHLQKHPVLPLEAIAYTLNTGRAHFEYRCALVVSSTQELKEVLEDIKRGKSPSSYLKARDEAPKGQEAIFKELCSKLLEDLETARSKPDIYKEKLLALADLYIKGYGLDLDLLHQEEAHQRISLPTYPFLKERYWIPETQEKESSSSLTALASKGRKPKLHPLVGENISTLKEQVFKTTFTGEEFYFKDHIVMGRKVLPGVAYLEMARAAGDLALPENQVVELQNVVWSKPLIVDQTEIEVNIKLDLQNEKVNYTIYSSQESDEVVYSQGTLVYGESKGTSAWEIVSNLERRLTKIRYKDAIYQNFSDLGVNLGNAFQVLEWVRMEGEEALGYYKVSTELNHQNVYILHPSIIDGIVQTGVNLLFSEDASNTLSIPFALEKLKLYHLPPSEGYVYVKKVAASRNRLALQLLDEKGRVYIELESLSIRPVSIQGLKKETVRDLEYYTPQWEASPLQIKQGQEEITQNICVISENSDLVLYLRDQLSGSSIIHLKNGPNYAQIDEQTYQSRLGEAEDYRNFIQAIQRKGITLSHFIWAESLEQPEQGANAYLDGTYKGIVVFIKALIDLKVDGNLRFIIPYQTGNEDFSPEVALVGFSRSLQQEHARYHLQVVGLDNSNSLSEPFSKIINELQYGENYHVFYKGNERQVESYRALSQEELTQGSLPQFRQRGVYLITGGLGGLGLVFSAYLAQNHQAKLVLTGRSALTPDKQRALKKLEDYGTEAIYLEGDVSDQETVERWVEAAKQRFGGLHGVIHTAGIIEDRMLLQKDWASFKSVLSPKVAGTLNLDKATQSEDLDFFILFSSIASFIGNVGQTDYSTSNAFLDYFAAWRDKERKRGRRHGKSLSLNWPLWAEGGMQVTEEKKQYMQQQWGLLPLPTELGVQALVKGLSLPYSQIIPVHTHKDKFKHVIERVNHMTIQQKIIPQAQPPVSSAPKVESPLDKESKILELVMSDIVSLVAEVSALSPSSIDMTKDLGNYGFDSITFTNLTNRLKETYGFAVTPALFFEYPTIESFANYLWQTQSDALIERYSPKLESPSPKEDVNDKNKNDKLQPAQPSVEVNKTSSRFSHNPTQSLSPSPKREQNQEERRINGTGDIAIIGMAGVLPDSENVDEFWQHLILQEDMISEIPPERFDWRKYQTEEYSIPKWGGFMKEVDKFDAPFFNIPPREAELMDPQQRLFLQTVWHAIEDSGYTPEDLAHEVTGLFAGVATHDYTDIVYQMNVLEAHSTTGIAHSILVNRVSYFLNLKGPSEAIHTACSSSLTAIHRAIRAIQDGDCDFAIAGGVNALLTPTLFITFTKSGMISQDGRCKTFDKAANGYVRGEGVGAIILKPLKRALNDGDRIYGVIRGASVNHGGRVNTLTAPNPNAQAELLVKAYERAGISPDNVTYIEAHGTGTSLGDPIEVNGLKKAFKILADKRGINLRENSCAIGSVKANIGHLEAAAGIGGVIKVLLMLKHKKIPGQVNFKELNPYIELKNTPFYVVEKTQDWQPSTSKIAGISSFGFGGANAHVIIEEGPEFVLSTEQTKPSYLLTLSAKHPESLKQKLEDMREYIQKNPELPLEAIAYTLNAGRVHFDYRCALVVSSTRELLKTLEQVKQGNNTSSYLAAQGDASKGQERIFNELCSRLLQDLAGALSNPNLYREKLLALADLYIKGYKLDLNLLHQGEALQRISLPTYPFLRERYWFGDRAMKRGRTSGNDSIKGETFNETRGKEGKEISLKSFNSEPISDQQQTFRDKNFQQASSSPKIHLKEIIRKEKEGFLDHRQTSFLPERIKERIKSISHPFLEISFIDAKENDIILSLKFKGEENSFLTDHKLYNENIISTDVYIEMVYLACRAVLGEDHITLQNIQLIRALAVSPHSPPELKILIRRKEAHQQFAIFSQSSFEGGDRQFHIKGEIAAFHSEPVEQLKKDFSFEGSYKISFETIYNNLSRKRDSKIGPFYQSIQEIAYTEERALITLAPPSDKKELKGYFLINPPIINGAFTSALLLASIPVANEINQESDLFLPSSIESFVLHGPLQDDMYYAYLHMIACGPSEVSFDINIVNMRNIIVARIQKLITKIVRPENIRNIMQA